MSFCDGIECRECGGSSECVTERCVEDGRDSATCCYCLSEAGDIGVEEVCDDCAAELDDR